MGAKDGKKRKPAAKKAEVAKPFVPPKVDDPDYLESKDSKTKIDITSKQGKSIAVTETQKKYIRNEGLDVYSEARSQGYGVKGAAMLLALSANESAYGDEKNYDIAVQRNNFFGDENTDGEKVIFPDHKTGIEGGVSFFDKNKAFVDFRKTAREDDPNITSLGEEMKDYNPVSDGGHGPKYVSWLNENMIPQVAQRMLETIKELQATRDKDAKEIATLSMFPKPLDPYNAQKLKGAQDELKELDAEKDKLMHIQHELTTGLPDKAPNWPIKKDKQAQDSQEPWHPPMSLPVNRQDTQPFTPYKLPFETGSVDGENTIQGYGLNENTNMQSGGEMGMPAINIAAVAGSGGASAAPAFAPVLMNIPSAGNMAPAVPAANGGGGISFNFENLGTHKNNANASGSQANNMHDQLLAVLTSAVADSKISGDVY